ncbi:MAG: hypothetical protein LN412_04735, partial [Candidatus Thermoplasmatota archaeon]|nr:hypothetical protein [Candidatus Thermoplasmatota archaeon]
MRETFKRWEGIIGKRKTKNVVERLYEEKVAREFNNNNVYSGNNSVLSKLEGVGGALLEMDFLDYPEKREMVNALAEDLVSKTLSEEFIASLSAILEREYEEERWLEDEIDEIRKLLDSMK